jgi:hypothetical protein
MSVGDEIRMTNALSITLKGIVHLEFGLYTLLRCAIYYFANRNASKWFGQKNKNKM